MEKPKWQRPRSGSYPSYRFSRRQKPIPPKRMNPSQPAVRVFMRAKLANSQTSLEGLVTEDFGKIQTGAEKMLVMSHAASWFVVQTPKFDEHTTEFRRNARQLIKMAKKANIDGATLSYLQLTMNCINCHNHVRSVKTVWFKPAKHNIVDSHDFQPQSAFIRQSTAGRQDISGDPPGRMRTTRGQ